MKFLHRFRLALASLILASCQSKDCHVTVENVITTPTSYKINPARHFHYSADSVRLCRIPDTQVLFFNEPGNVYIELSPHEGMTRVSGTKLNNEWQALNDTVAKYDQLLRDLFGNHSDSLYNQVSAIYDTLQQRILQTADRNRDNALGHFISLHFVPQNN